MTDDESRFTAGGSVTAIASLRGAAAERAGDLLGVTDEEIDPFLTLLLGHADHGSTYRHRTENVSRRIEYGRGQSGGRVVAFPRGDGVPVGPGMGDQAAKIFGASDRTFRQLLEWRAQDRVREIRAPRQQHPGGRADVQRDHLADVHFASKRMTRLCDGNAHPEVLLDGEEARGLPRFVPQFLQHRIDDGEHVEGLTPFWDILFAHAKDRPTNEAAVRELFQPKTTQWQYTHGVPADRCDRIAPDAWQLDQAGLDRPQSDAIQLQLFWDYQFNLDGYPAFQEYFRSHQPPTLVTTSVVSTAAPASSEPHDRADVMFVANMLPHHQQAVLMSEPIKPLPRSATPREARPAGYS